MNRAEEFERLRPLLFSIAYRILGSVSEAEDAVQETWLRYAASPTQPASAKAFLSAAVTRVSIDVLRSARVRREEYVGQWLPEPLLTDPYQDPERSAQLADSVSMAALLLLERLSPLERAVFVLREVFGFGFPEVASAVGRSEAACRQLFSRARAHIADHRPRFDARPDEHRRLVEQFMRAARTGDVDGLAGLLAEDATLWADGGGKVPGAALRPLHGRSQVARFVAGVTARLAPAGATYTVAGVNGRPALLVRRADGHPVVVVCIEVERSHIRTVWAIGNPDKLGAVQPLTRAPRPR